MTKVIVIGPNAFGGVCMAASLNELPGVLAERCADPTRHAGDDPDIVLLQDLENPLDPHWLADWLRRIPRFWPAALMMVVTGDILRDSPLCLQSGVQACLSSTATLDELAATILLIRGGMIVYHQAALMAVLSSVGGHPREVAGVRGVSGRSLASGNGVMPH